MDTVMKKLQNFWFYYKIPTIIGIVALIFAAYLSFQSASAPKPDYHVGLISTTPRSEEALESLTDAIAAAGEDLNGDGEVLVQLHKYYVDLTGDPGNVDQDRTQIVGALDADLIGNVSGLFLMEDPQDLQSVTGGILAEPWFSFLDGLQLCIRNNAEEEYRALYEALN